MTPAPPSTTYYIRHCDPNSTGEGLGSHARRTLYPLLQVALHFGWTVIWEYDQQPCWKNNEYREYYSQECMELGPWLGFDTKLSDLDRDRTINVPLHIDGDDARFGNLRGAPELINFCLEEFIRQHGMDHFVGRQDRNRDYPFVLVTLYGRFHHQDDPSPPVLQWMHRRCRQWKDIVHQRQHESLLLERSSIDDDGDENDRNCSSNHHVINTTKMTRVSDECSITTFVPLNIVVHVRVPEDICTQEWKDANSVSHVLTALEQFLRQWNNIRHEQQQKSKKSGLEVVEKYTTKLQLDVYTEESFTQAKEDEFTAALSEMRLLDHNGNDDSADPTASPAIISQLRFHRQTPLLPCVQSMAVSDVFFPASSYLSSMAAFFHTSLIVLPNESTRHDPYFATHLKYRRKYHRKGVLSRVDVDTETSDASICSANTSGGNESSTSTTASSSHVCPIVRVEEEEELKEATLRLWQGKTR